MNDLWSVCLIFNFYARRNIIIIYLKTSHIITTAVYVKNYYITYQTFDSHKILTHIECRKLQTVK